DEGNIVWSKDGTQIYFVSLHVDEPYYEQPKSELYSISANGGSATKLNLIDMDLGGLSLSPDGKQLAFVASVTQPVNSYTQPDLWVVDLTTNAKPRNLTATFDFDIGNGPFGDNAAPRAGGRNPPIWTADGKSLIELYGKEGKSILASFDATSGAVTDLVSGNQAVLRVRASNDASKLVYTSSTATRINDLFVLDREPRNDRGSRSLSESANAQPQQLTDVNKELFSKLNLTEPEEISYKSFDGKPIQAWVQKPPDFNAAKKYPLILNIHGGPHAAYGYIFEHEFQWMAAKRYMLLLPNPRGSTTYGQDFKARSPITYIKDVKTPTMFILGEVDYRTPPGAGGEEMFRALKFQKIPTVMVRFPNESHELSRSGQPWHRVERLQNIVGWFDHWLLGVAKPEYEVAPKEEVSIKRESTEPKPAKPPR